ncbi:MAG: glutamine-hydrolyzing GMP synthase [Thermotogae bacterium]|nr:glutamine-hydrolyzing GMP synthase [Thermotogota bacterium]
MEKILVVDFGSQYTQLLARRIREIGVYSEVVQYDETSDLKDVGGIILSGGPDSVYSEFSPKIPEYVFEKDIPVLGVCYGMQSIAKIFGGKVKREKVSEYGKTKVRVTKESVLFDGVTDSFVSWMSHGDSVIEIPENCEILAETTNGIIASFRFKDKPIYTIQFHPEVRHTEFGNIILENFVSRICGLSNTWSLKDFINTKIEEIRETVGDRKAIIGLSGGVDSSVAAVLMHRAIGKNLKAVFVDHGLLRLNEENDVRRIFREILGLDLTVIDARETFLTKLKGVEEPEKKRKIIGEEFIRAFEKEASKESGYQYLVQGTIYSDVIESAFSGKKTSVIKSHHNVGGLPEKMNFKILEPLRELFKDEVRSVGELIGIPKHILYRHPFPGPGLAIRVIGDITEEKLNILKQVDNIFIETLHETGWYEKVWQAFSVLTPVKSVGVVGDERSYDYVVALRSVDSVEGMTADWSRIPYEVLEKASGRIVNEVEGVGRVVYDITSKPPATIEWE